MPKAHTTPVCFWCRNPKPMSVKLRVGSLSQPGEFAMLDYEPCDGCMDKIMIEKHGTGSRGIFVIEVLPYRSVLPNQPQIGDGPALYPTGRWAVVEVPAAMVIFYDIGIPQEVIQNAISQKRLLMAQFHYQEMMDYGKPKSPFILDLNKL